MKYCPLLAQEIAPQRCKMCMYLAKDESCLHGVKSTRDFALAKGIPANEVGIRVTQAELRVQTAIVLDSYLSWIVDNLGSLSACSLVDNAESALLELHTELGLDRFLLEYAVNPANWDLFSAKNASSFGLDEVLMLSIPLDTLYA